MQILGLVIVFWLAMGFDGMADARPGQPSASPRLLRDQDPGIRLEIERGAYRVIAFDLASGEYGPSVQVAVGSPEYETPPGTYRLRNVVYDPAWRPGPTARNFGAKPIEPSPNGPLGIAKIPFAGAYALHGGANQFSVGKPVTLGCLRSLDGELADLLDWLESRHALGEIHETPHGERPQHFVRPAHLVIR